MFYPDELVEAIESLGSSEWSGVVFRHMFAEYTPLLENRRGARWNPPQVPAIYASLERKTVLAEAEFQIASQPLPPRARRTIYQLRVRLQSVVDLTAPGALAKTGLRNETLGDSDLARTQLVGGAVEWCRHDGMFVPSARTNGTNLVIFPNQRVAEIEVVAQEPISE